MARFGAADLVVEAKPDLTPVSDADRAVEQAIRARLAEVRADDAVSGEEFGSTGAGRPAMGDRSDRRDEELRSQRAGMGDLDRAAGRRRARSSASCPRPRSGGGGGRIVAVAPGAAPRRPAAATVGLGGRRPRRTPAWPTRRCPAGRRSARRDAFVALTDQVWRSRAYGDFWSYMLVAEGAVDLAAEPELSLWDMAALSPVVTEAGGRFTGLGRRRRRAARQRRGEQRAAASAVPRRAGHA